MFGLAVSLFAVVGTITAGVVMRKKGVKGGKRMFAAIAAGSFAVLMLGAVISVAMPGAASAAEEAAVAADTSSNGLGFIGMALATGLACVGAGIAVGSVGAAALGLVGEQPGAIGTTLIYVGLAEGVAIYGIVISMLIFSRLG